MAGQPQGSGALVFNPFCAPHKFSHSLVLPQVVVTRPGLLGTDTPRKSRNPHLCWLMACCFVKWSPHPGLGCPHPWAGSRVCEPGRAAVPGQESVAAGGERRGTAHVDSRLVHSGLPGSPRARLQKGKRPCGVPCCFSLLGVGVLQRPRAVQRWNPSHAHLPGASSAPQGQILAVGFGGPLRLLKQNSPD